MTKVDVIIIGAGAAGLMCAATAANKGLSVLVLDHANKIAKKVLMSGGGRCNFTNLNIEHENYISHNPHFFKSALSRYTQWDFIALVAKYEIPYFEKEDGQLFCERSSKDIRDLLLNECQSAGAKIQLKCSISKIKDLEDNSFLLETNLGQYQANSLVVACGGLSIPTMGATGFGYEIAKQYGHNIFPTQAGLSPLTFSGNLKGSFAALSGNSFNASVSCNNHSFNGAVLFTHKGLSGPAILQISSYWQKGEPIEINWLPQLDCETWLYESIKSRPEQSLKNCLASQFSQAIASFIAEKNTLNKKLKQLDHKEIKQLIQFLTAWKVYPNDLEGYRVAEVTLGGVDTSQISSKTFESNLRNNLYFIGEVLDVTGHLGGYNFQWAWASGHAAGESV